MRIYETHDLLSPTHAIANDAAFPYSDRFAAARAYLAQRGIAEMRPLYGPRARAASLGDRLAARAKAPRGAPGA